MGWGSWLHGLCCAGGVCSSEGSFGVWFSGYGVLMLGILVVILKVEVDGQRDLCCAWCGQ